MLRHIAMTLAVLSPGPILAEVAQERPNGPFQPAFENQTRAPELPTMAVTATHFAGPLGNPWGIAQLPDGTFLVTERPGRMRLVATDGTLSDPIEGVPEVLEKEQGGLLDVAVSPGFAADRTVFWTYAKPTGDDMVATAAARGTLSEDGSRLSEVRDIFVQMPPSASKNHFGSRVVPDGQGHVFITTGEHYELAEREHAQDPNITWGKVIRINEDGTVPSDNPFVAGGGAPEVWTLGHRNPQGAATDAQGRPWTIEHGPMGGDELNLSVPGTNYGWPEVSYGLNYEGDRVGIGEPRAEGFAEPNYYWDSVIAPSGMTFYRGTLFPDWQGDLLIASLSPGGLVRIRIEGERVVGEEWMLRDLGRVRDVEELPDGSLLLLTDEWDGEIVRVTPQ